MAIPPGSSLLALRVRPSRGPAVHTALRGARSERVRHATGLTCSAGSLSVSPADETLGKSARLHRAPSRTANRRPYEPGARTADDSRITTLHFGQNLASA